MYYTYRTTLQIIKGDDKIDIRDRKMVLVKNRSE